jgi:two-component system, sensor histidine kinase
LKKTETEIGLSLLTRVPDMYLYLDTDLYILDATDSFLDVTYTQRAFLKGKNFFEVFPGNKSDNSDENEFQISFDYVVTEKVSHGISVQPYFLTTHSGISERKYFKVSNTPILNDLGDILFIIHRIGVMTELTEDHVLLNNVVKEKGLTEEQVRQETVKPEVQKNVIQEFADQSPFPMGIFRGPEYVVEAANSAMCEIWNMQPEDVIGNPLFDVFPGLRNQGFKELLDGVMRTGIPYIGKELPVVIKRQGIDKVYYYDLIYHPLTGPDGSISGISVAASDVTAAVEAHEEIRESRDRIGQLLDNLPEITWTAIPTGEINFYNRKWYEYTGLSYEETRDWGWKIAVHPDDYDHTMKIYTEAIAGGNEYETELRLKRASDGEFRWHLSRAVPHRNREGKVTLWIGTTIDIHQLKTTEVELMKLRLRENELHEQSEKERIKLYNLFMDVPAMMCVLRTREHIFELVNPLYQELYRGRQLVGKPVREALPELSGQGVFELLDHVYNYGETFIGTEVPMALGDEKETRYFNYIYKPTSFDKEDEINGIIGFGFEVTGEVVARRSLEESEQRLRIAQKAANIGTFEWNLLTDKISYTAQVEIILGFVSQKLVAEPEQIMKLVYPEDEERIRNEIQDCLNTRRNIHLEFRIVRPDAAIRWINLTGEIFYEVSGTPDRVVGVILDITERVETARSLEAKNTELQHINTDLDNFIYTASHDLKAPISNLEGLLNALGQETAFTGEQQVIVELMFQSVQRFKTTIMDLTEISKAQRGQQEDLETILFEEIINQLLPDISDLIDRFNPRIEFNFLVPSVKYSKKNLRSILYNLISNAIKYSSPLRQPVIKVSSEKKGSCVLLSVQDNGLGLSGEDQDKIFGMFKRAHQHVEGTGIGLYVIKRMIENSGGKIEVESEIDTGTTFRVYLSSC